jgi:hypothetical protein
MPRVLRKALQIEVLSRQESNATGERRNMGVELPRARHTGRERHADSVSLPQGVVGDEPHVIEAVTTSVEFNDVHADPGWKTLAR